MVGEIPSRFLSSEHKTAVDSSQTIRLAPKKSSPQRFIFLLFIFLRNADLLVRLIRPQHSVIKRVVAASKSRNYFWTRWKEIQVTERSLGLVKFSNAATQRGERRASSCCHQSRHQTGGRSVSVQPTVHTALSSNTIQGLDFVWLQTCCLINKILERLLECVVQSTVCPQTSRFFRF